MSSRPVVPTWLRIDEEENAIDYLEKAVRFIREAKEDPSAWKWVMVSLNGALYGFMICVLKGTHPANVTKNVTAPDKWLADWGSGKPVYLIDFGVALKRCQEENHMHLGSRPLLLTKAQERSIDALRKVFRNQFEHFMPKGWSINVARFPRIAMDALDVIYALVFDIQSFMHLEQSQVDRVRSSLSAGRKGLEEMLDASERP